MNSFSEIDRVDYQEYKTSVISLLQYILFIDDNKKNKFAVFKFRNSLNQNVDCIRCEVCEYNCDDLLLEKQIIEYKDFSAKCNEEFVPNAKLSLNNNTTTLRVNLIYAHFERVIWENGEFSPIPYTIKEFREEKKNDIIINNDVKKVKTKISKYEKKEIKKLKKRPIYVKNLTKLNRNSKSSIILSLIILLLGSIGLTIYFKTFNHQYYDGTFQYKVNDNAIEIVAFDSNVKSVDIPNEIDGVKVKSIKANAFSNSKVEVVNILSDDLTIENCGFKNAKKLKEFNQNENGSLIIGSNAFEGCESLESITLNGVDIINEYTFKNCISLKSVSLPDSKMGNFSLANTKALESLTYGTSSGQFCLMFGSSNDDISSNLMNISTYMGYINSSYFGEISQIRSIDFLNDQFECAYGALTGLTGISNLYSDGFVEIYNDKVTVNSAGDVFTLSNNFDSKYLNEVVEQLKLLKNIKSLKLENKKYYYDNSFFSSFPNLNELYLSENVNIDFDSLNDNYNLKIIHLDVDALNTLTLNNSFDRVEILGSGVLKYDSLSKISNVKNLIINKNVELSMGCFSNLNNLVSITMPISNLSLSALSLTKNIKELNFNCREFSTSTPYDYISGYSNITKIVIPEGIKMVNEYLVSSCGKLEELVIPTSVTKMGITIIGYGCDNLKYVTTPFVGETQDSTIAYEFFNLSHNSTTHLVISCEMKGSSDFSSGLENAEVIEFKDNVSKNDGLLNKCEKLITLTINNFSSVKDITSNSLTITSLVVNNSTINLKSNIIVQNLYLDDNSNIDELDLTYLSETNTIIHFKSLAPKGFKYAGKFIENSVYN